MPSPYGEKRSAASYYQYGGEPQRFVIDWTGVPFPSSRHGQASLGDYPVALTLEYPYAQSVLHSGPEQSHIIDGLGMSDNEKLGLGIAVLGVAAYFVWKKLK